jgi:octaprenyl-diphosphate synthase
VKPELLKTALADEMREVDRVLRARLHSDVALVRQVAEYIVAGGGKRLRPALLLLASAACGYEGPHRFTLAAVVELIHTATLLHDDVVDESLLRRGSATANATFGNAASVLVGDFVYSRSFQMMVDVGDIRVLQVLSDATNEIAEGEVLQLLHSGSLDLRQDAYLEVVRRKTAKLFEAAARLGAILARAPADVEDALARYGMHLGTAFQLIDDVLDYSGERDKIGKNVGDDLAEGKATLPIIHALRVGMPEDRATLERAFTEPREADFDAVLAAIERTGALDYARSEAQAESARAIAALSPLGESTARQSLLELATFAVTRTH